MLTTQAGVDGVVPEADLLMGSSLEISPLSRAITHDGHTVFAQIVRSQPSEWTLEVIDAFGNFTGWLEIFESDQKALDEFYRALLEEGIGSLVGGPSNFE